MQFFHYESIDLEGPSFRLLLLRSGDAGDAIESLSYTWGIMLKGYYITIDGGKLPVTANLFYALQALRLPNIDRVIGERGHQVQQMETIYSRAEQVIIWLGPGAYETNAAMDSIKQIEDESRQYEYREWGPTNEHRTKIWSSRVWILQEVANARSAIVCSGQKSVSAYFFALAPSLIQVQPNSRTPWWSQNRDLYILLIKFKESKASDPRDMVYALLGIASDTHEDRHTLHADYTKTEAKLVYDVNSFLFHDFSPNWLH
ncbi:hypothetical protein BO71DRAFT_416682 [Aspergillus ellipticus CBS 707.79]|uniref:Heterokaryon incompatibility domain-containing protein n=1 Tax=Aspergillus ellipticus CBS 707.79 TaxID=1448320 RepID=A0A319E2F1_9EURO|nr:hypothetical protein BO71DRAFT_416682 [Aspergillus ellipticus CBS 707.79]